MLGINEVYDGDFKHEMVAGLAKLRDANGVLDRPMAARFVAAIIVDAIMVVLLLPFRFVVSGGLALQLGFVSFTVWSFGKLRIPGAGKIPTLVEVVWKRENEAGAQSKRSQRYPHGKHSTEHWCCPLDNPDINLAVTEIPVPPSRCTDCLAAFQAWNSSMPKACESCEKMFREWELHAFVHDSDKQKNSKS